MSATKASLYYFSLVAHGVPESVAANVVLREEKLVAEVARLRAIIARQQRIVEAATQVRLDIASMPPEFQNRFPNQENLHELRSAIDSKQ